MELKPAYPKGALVLTAADGFGEMRIDARPEAALAIELVPLIVARPPPGFPEINQLPPLP